LLTLWIPWGRKAFAALLCACVLLCGAVVGQQGFEAHRLHDPDVVRSFMESQGLSADQIPAFALDSYTRFSSMGGAEWGGQGLALLGLGCALGLGVLGLLGRGPFRPRGAQG